MLITEMKNLVKFSILASALVVAFSFSDSALAQATKKGAVPAAQAPAAPATAPAAPAKAAKAAPAGAASANDIAEAAAKGLVWVNTDSKVYHNKDGKFYGKTKQGKFMAEADAQKAGYRAAKVSPIGKKKS